MCADFYGKMREMAAEWFERPVAQLTKEVSWGLREWGIERDEQYESLHRFAVTQRAFFKEVPMIPGARRYLRRLSDEGARIRIITHRLTIRYFHNLAVTQTTEWLDQHGIPYWDICFMKDKEQVGANIYVEDGPDYIDRLRRMELETICFANSTNMRIGPPRANSWEGVHRLVHEIWRSKKRA